MGPWRIGGSPDFFFFFFGNELIFILNKSYFIFFSLRVCVCVCVCRQSRATFQLEEVSREKRLICMYIAKCKKKKKKDATDSRGVHLTHL